MKYIFTLLTLFTINTLSAIDMGDSAINFNVQTINGNNVNLEELKNKKAIWLVFWATWCPNCKAEIPALKKFYEKYNDKIQIIGVNIGVEDSVLKVRKYVKKYNIPYDIIFSKKIAQDYGVIGTPTQVAIDINGDVVYTGMHIPKDLDEIIEEMLEQ